jgi:hypothetical protein
MPTFFCPSCFAGIDPATRICPACGADVAAWRGRAYPERLVHALLHPLADVRMTAIDALGRLRAPGAAWALADCAMRHPRDPVQGMAIIHALERLPRDAAWLAAVRSLREHPVAAVARAAAGLAENAGETPAPGDDPAAFRALIDDYADHAAAIERLAGMGEGAIRPLRRYLREGPQANPQGRLFAVDMLARLRSAEATAGLREVLRGTPLRELPASQRDAEYQVRDAALRHLVGRDYPERDADVACALQSERLPGAVAAAGRLGLAALAPDLVRMLGDDVLEGAADEALLALGEAAVAAILAALPALLDAERDNARARLALVRTLLVLWRLHAMLPPEPAREARRRHPFVAAAAALFEPPGQDGAGRLLDGAAGDLAGLANACRERLRHPAYGPWLSPAAAALLRRAVEPDIYGNARPLSRESARWLAGLAGAASAGLPSSIETRNRQKK